MGDVRIDIDRFSRLSSRRRRQLKDLRFRAFRELTSLSEHLVDDYDRSAHIVQIIERDRLVASVRFRLPTSDEESETAAIVDLPDDIPRWDKTIEASRTCVDPDAQGRGHFSRLMGQLGKWCWEHDYRYLLGFARDEILGLYSSVGIHPQETRFDNHPAYPGMPHAVVMADYQKVAQGIGVDDRRWKEAYEPVFQR